jgi:hypothetical protein
MHILPPLFCVARIKHCKPPPPSFLRGAQVLELGVLNATIHQINEHVNVDDLEPLAEIYEQILVELLA